MTTPIIVLGSGGHARVVLDVLRLLGREIVGLTTEDRALFGSDVDDDARLLLGVRGALLSILASDAGAIPEHPFLVYQIAGGAVRSATY